MARQRRERGEGAIFYSKTRHRWVGQLDAGTDSAGTRIRPIVVGRTRDEARDKLALHKRGCSEGWRVGPRVGVEAFR